MSRNVCECSLVPAPEILFTSTFVNPPLPPLKFMSRAHGMRDPPVAGIGQVQSYPEVKVPKRHLVEHAKLKDVDVCFVGAQVQRENPVKAIAGPSAHESCAVTRVVLEGDGRPAEVKTEYPPFGCGPPIVASRDGPEQHGRSDNGLRAQSDNWWRLSSWRVYGSPTFHRQCTVQGREGLLASRACRLRNL